MKYIQKTTEPQFLTDYRNDRESENETKTHKEIWDDFGKKKDENGKSLSNELWDILWKEQGGICAYCGSRIDNMHGNDDFFNDNTNVNRLEKGTKRREHMQPKSLEIHRDKIFLYSNLLAVCQGNEVPNQRNNPNNFHCDAKKKEKPIPNLIFPTNPNCESVFKYEEENDENEDLVRIIPINDIKDNDISTAIEKILGLNFKTLKERRYKAKEISSDILSEFRNKALSENALKEQLEKRIIVQDTKNEKGSFKECTFVTKYFLQKALNEIKNTEGVKKI